MPLSATAIFWSVGDLRVQKHRRLDKTDPERRNFGTIVDGLLEVFLSSFRVTEGILEVFLSSFRVTEGFWRFSCLRFA